MFLCQMFTPTLSTRKPRKDISLWISSLFKPVSQSQILGNGSTALVVLQDGLAVKMPLRYLWTSEVDFASNLHVVRLEQDVYRRLQPSEGPRHRAVVTCVGFSPNATQLAHMKNGDLRSFLTKHEPSHSQKLSWFRDTASGLSYIHSWRVLVIDIASRNFLIDSDRSIKSRDFTESAIFPLETDMSTAEDLGYTVQLDIRLLGAVFYEVVTGKKCDIDLYQEADDIAHWPQRETLPSTKYLWLGSVIEQCWTGGFHSADSLLQALDTINGQPEMKLQNNVIGDFLLSLHGFVSQRPTAVTMAGLFTMAAVLVWSQKRAGCLVQLISKLRHIYN